MMKKIYICLCGFMLGIGISAQTNDALVEASVRGDLAEVQRLVEEGADVNAWDRYGKFPLIRAAAGCHLSVVKYLVAQGADVNISDAYATPIIASGDCGLEQIKFLVGRGANTDDIFFDDGIPNTALIWALDSTCSFGDTKQTCAEDLDKLEYILNQTAEHFFIFIGMRTRNFNYRYIRHLWLGGFYSVDSLMMAYVFRGDINALKDSLNNDSTLNGTQISFLLLLAYLGGHEQILYYLLEEMRIRHT